MQLYLFYIVVALACMAGNNHRMLRVGSDDDKQKMLDEAIFLALDAEVNDLKGPQDSAVEQGNKLKEQLGLPPTGSIDWGVPPPSENSQSGETNVMKDDFSGSDMANGGDEGQEKSRQNKITFKHHPKKHHG